MTKKKKKAKRLHCREEGCKWTCSMSLPFKERMAKLRRHRKKKHPKAHKKSVKKTLKTKRKKGLINKKGSNPAGCYRIQVGTGLGLLSKCLSKKDAEKYARFIDKGGMQVYVIAPKRKKKGGNPCK